MSPSFKSEVIRIEDVPAEMRAGEMSKPLVLVVDDEPLVTDTLAAILQKSGYRTVRAYDGVTALRLAAEKSPALLVSDVAMPGMSGVELAIAISEMSAGCKVLLFSGHATRADLTDAAAAGYDFPLLCKPVPPAEMLKQIAKCLEAPAAMPKSVVRTPSVMHARPVMMLETA